MAKKPPSKGYLERVPMRKLASSIRKELLEKLREKDPDVLPRKPKKG
jgi:hypothetical protein